MSIDKASVLRYFKTPKGVFTLILLVLTVIDSMIGTGNITGNSGADGVSFSAHLGLLGGIYSLAVLLPGLAVAIRRLHDTDRSGWWVLIALVPFVGGIVLLVFFVLEGTRGPNRAIWARITRLRKTFSS